MENKNLSEQTNNYRYMSKVYYKDNQTFIDLFVNLKSKPKSRKKYINDNTYVYIEFDGNSQEKDDTEKEFSIIPLVSFVFDGGNPKSADTIEKFIDEKSNNSYYDKFRNYENLQTYHNKIKEYVNNYEKEDYKIDDISLEFYNIQKIVEEQLQEPLKDFNDFIKSIFEYFNSQNYRDRLYKEQSKRLTEEYIDKMKELQLYINSFINDYRELDDNNIEQEPIN